MFSICSAPDLELALHVQFGSMPAESRNEHVADLIDSKRRGRLDLTCFAAMSDDDRLQAVQLFVLQRDGTSHAYPVVFARSDGASSRPLAVADRREIVTALFAAIDTRFVESHAWIAQSLLATNRKRARQEFSRHGYGYLTDLVFMELAFDETTRLELSGLEGNRLERLSYDESRKDRFAKLLEASYVDSTDCPELNGRRNGVQALESHKLSGEFSPEHWNLFVLDGQDVGILLQSEHVGSGGNDHGNGGGVCEVVYLGLIPSARRKGLGRAILDFGLCQAKAAGCESVMLGVDVRNRAAINMYEHVGFAEFDRRVVHARFR